MTEELLRRGVVESYLRLVRNEGALVAILRLRPAEALEERLREGVALLHEQSDFSPLFLCEDGSLLLFLRQMHLHAAVRSAKGMRELLRTRCGLDIVCGALTLMDADDGYETLKARLDTYMARAEKAGGGKICYGNVHYDFCARGGEKRIFDYFFSGRREVSIYNFYNGMPLHEKVTVLGYENGLLKIKTSLAKAAFLRNEPFTYIRHPQLPDTIRADVVTAIPGRAEVTLGNLHFIDTSPLDRENIRISPEESIEVSIGCSEGEAVVGKLEAIAVNSIAVRTDAAVPDACLEESAQYTVAFNLPERETGEAHIGVTGTLRCRKEGVWIFSIYPNHFAKQKIESYIARQQSKLITILQKMVLNFYQG
ncbi:MAG: hypothetical protein GXO33_05340 [Epsilonproteobacteria bacterium]|nr:hypothetical protein [Campylobacterota bacterium]